MDLLSKYPKDIFGLLWITGDSGDQHFSTQMTGQMSTSPGLKNYYSADSDIQDTISVVELGPVSSKYDSFSCPFSLYNVKNVILEAKISAYIFS